MNFKKILVLLATNITALTAYGLDLQWYSCEEKLIEVEYLSNGGCTVYFPDGDHRTGPSCDASASSVSFWSHRGVKFDASTDLIFYNGKKCRPFSVI